VKIYFSKMKKTVLITFGIILFGISGFYSYRTALTKTDGSRILSYVVDPQNQDLKFYWKDKSGEIYGNFQRLKTDLLAENRELVFAMNGGMYLKDQSPQGLYIENGVTYARLDTVKSGFGNFYMQPNGIFYLTTDLKAVVCPTGEFKNDGDILYATQSGPMLLIEGKMHSKFRKGSSNIHIRNGVGILPKGELLFAMSKEKINFYDFASYFKRKGCQNALYLDGFVSRVYLPSKNQKQWDGNFGVIIAVTTNVR